MKSHMATRITNRKKNELGTSIGHPLKSSSDFTEVSHLLTQSCGYSVELMAQPKREYHDFEEDYLFIAPVAVLQTENNTGMSWGVFAKQDINIHYEKCLGKYLGEVKQLSEKKQKKQDFNYTFDLKNGVALDAKHKRGWPAMVNGASCYESANVIAKKANGEVYYYLSRPIKAGEQLLIYYGDDYTCENKRFLNPSDNWEESTDKFKRLQSNYEIQTTQDQAFLNLLNFNHNQLAIPDPFKNNDYINIDTPILAYGNSRQLLPQNQQENITLLMLACWNVDFDWVNNLFKNGANPYQQTSIHGYSPLHFVVLSPIENVDQKINLIQYIVDQARSTLKLQDLHDETILHHAIKNQQVALAAAILRLDAGLSHYGDDRSIRDCLNDKDLDIFIEAVLSLNVQMMQTVLPYMRTKDISDLLENRKIIEQSFRTWSKKHGTQQLCQHLNAMKNLDRLSPEVTDLFAKYSEKFSRNSSPPPSLQKRAHNFFNDDIDSEKENKRKRLSSAAQRSTTPKK